MIPGQGVWTRCLHRAEAVYHAVFGKCPQLSLAHPLLLRQIPFLVGTLPVGFHDSRRMLSHLPLCETAGQFANPFVRQMRDVAKQQQCLGTSKYITLQHRETGSAFKWTV